MFQVAIAKTHEYNDIIFQQQKRIKELESDLARYTNNIRMLRIQAIEKHQVAIATATNLAQVQASHMQSMFQIPMGQHMNMLSSLSLGKATQVNSRKAQKSSKFGATPLDISSIPSCEKMGSLSSAQTTTSSGLYESPVKASKNSTENIGDTRTVEEDERTTKTRYWTELEHNQFLYGVKLFGAKNYVAISQLVGTRTSKQVRTHAQKYQMKLEREAKKRRTQASAISMGTTSAAPMHFTSATSIPVPHGGLDLQSVPFALSLPFPYNEGKMVATSFGSGIDGLQVPGMQRMYGHTVVRGHSVKEEVGIQSGFENVGVSCAVDDDDDDDDDEDDDDDDDDNGDEQMDGDGDKVEDVDMEGCESATSRANTESDELKGDIMTDGIPFEEVEAKIKNEECEDIDIESEKELKGHGDLTNLSDYDDFMRGIAAVVEDERDTNELFDDDGNNLAIDLLHDDDKREDFSDSLLVDM